jgi:hypothetical protein
MKALYTIAALTIANSFSLYAMEDIQNEKYMGIKAYYRKHPYISMSREGEAKIHDYCYPITYHSSESFTKRDPENPRNCEIINAYLLLNRRPQESVKEQINFYEQKLETAQKQLNSTFNVFEKNKLNQRILFLSTGIKQIRQTNLSGKPQDRNIQEQVGNALKNMNADTVYEMDRLEKAVERANQCNFLDNNQ